MCLINLGQLENLNHDRPIVAIGKHLCGAATGDNDARIVTFCFKVVFLRCCRSIFASIELVVICKVRAHTLDVRRMLFRQVCAVCPMCVSVVSYLSDRLFRFDVALRDAPTAARRAQASRRRRRAGAVLSSSLSLALVRRQALHRRAVSSQRQTVSHSLQHEQLGHLLQPTHR